MIMIENIFKHMRTVMTHRKWVRHYCFKIGLYKQGILHDLSKYSPTEFFESVRYYTGVSSPIDLCKKVNGYSNAWFHHRSRNKHHREYWVDNFDKGTVAIKMPKKYAFEMICDWIGAGRAYQKENYTPQKEYEWYLKQKMFIHPRIKDFTDMFMKMYSEKGDNFVTIENFEHIWNMTGIGE